MEVAQCFGINFIKVQSSKEENYGFNGLNI